MRDEKKAEEQLSSSHPSSFSPHPFQTGGSRMNRSRVGKWARRAVWGTLLAVTAIGCNPLNIAAFMFARDEVHPAPYPLAFGKDGPKKDKEEVVVLLLPQVAPGSREFVTADRELAEKLSRLLPELAKQNKDKDA